MRQTREQRLEAAEAARAMEFAASVRRVQAMKGIVDFVNELRFGDNPVAEALLDLARDTKAKREELENNMRWLMEGLQRDLHRLHETGDVSNSLGAVQGKGSEVDRLTGEYVMLQRAGATMARALGAFLPVFVRDSDARQHELLRSLTVLQVNGADTWAVYINGLRAEASDGGLIGPLPTYDAEWKAWRAAQTFVR